MTKTEKKLYQALQRAIDEAGGQRALARALGISRQAVHQWTDIPVRYVVRVEIATGIPRRELRPDFYE